ncbi:hypothetical protein THAOC_37062, partial [Thalassiosira oceanica]
MAKRKNGKRSSAGNSSSTRRSGGDGRDRMSRDDLKAELQAERDQSAKYAKVIERLERLIPPDDGDKPLRGRNKQSKKDLSSVTASNRPAIRKLVHAIAVENPAIRDNETRYGSQFSELLINRVNMPEGADVESYYNREIRAEANKFLVEMNSRRNKTIRKKF